MKNSLLILMGVLIAFSMLIAPAVQSCPCSCPVLTACYKSCKDLMPDASTTIYCDGGCLIACVLHGNS